MKQITAEVGEVSEAEVEAAAIAMAEVIRLRHGHLDKASWLNAQRREEARAALLAARRVQPKQDAPRPDVAGLIEALQTAKRAVGRLRLDPDASAADQKDRQAIDDAIAALSRLTRPKQDELCVPDAGEPQFVLLGRDPQAPPLVEEWAHVRRLAEPESPKPAMADEIAAKMRAYKAAHPEKGMAADALPKQDDARDSTVGAEPVA